MTPTKAEQIAAILSRLALHYWRPDFTPAQSKLLIKDFLSDLSDYSPDQIESACARYRRDPENKFFPKPGDLLRLLGARTFSGDQQPNYFLPKFRADSSWRQAGKPLPTVGEVLRKNGFDEAARKYENFQSRNNGTNHHDESQHEAP